MVLECLYNCVRGITARVVYGCACIVIVPSTMVLILIGQDVVNADYVPFVVTIGAAGTAVVAHKCICRECDNSPREDPSFEMGNI